MQRVVEFILENWDSIAGIVATVIAWLVSRPIIAERKAKAEAWVKANKMTAAVDLACGVVAEVYRTTVRSLKESGKFDAEAKARVANDAAAVLRSQLAEHGMELLQAMAPALVEMAVNRMKGNAAVVASDGPEIE